MNSKSKKLKPADQKISPTRIVLSVFAVVLISGLLYSSTFYNYLLFHSIAEIFSVVVAIGIFMIAWESRKFAGNYFMLFVGIVLLFIASIDIVHVLAYAGMGVFIDFDANLPTQLWIAARYFQAISMIVALLFIKRKFNPNLIVTIIGAVFILLLLSIFYWKIFPDCFIVGSGLTPFKKISEYVISLILLLFIIGLYVNREHFNKRTLNWLYVSGIAMIISEIAFTYYVSVYGLSNFVGHIFKIAAFCGLYIAIVRNSLINPYNNLCFTVDKRNKELEKAHQEMSEEVKKRRELEQRIRTILKS